MIRCEQLPSSARGRPIEGPTVFDRFFGGEEGTRWYYRTLARVLAARVRDEPRIAWFTIVRHQS